MTNVMEVVVHDVLKKHLHELDLSCDCERCLTDIVALALNALPPRYVVDPSHVPYVRAAHEADRQGATNILCTVARAASIVSESPRCQHVKTNHQQAHTN